MIAISAVPLPCNWGGIPQISAVFMGLAYALARTDTGSFWSRSGVSGSFLVTESRLSRAGRDAPLGRPRCMSAYPTLRHDHLVRHFPLRCLGLVVAQSALVNEWQLALFTQDDS